MSSYHAVALCVANTCNDEAREIIAVIEESVRLEDIAKFFLTAHGKKMDRTSSKTRDLRFLGGNRSLQKAARNQSTLVALPGGVKLPGMSNIPCFWVESWRRQEQEARQLLYHGLRRHRAAHYCIINYVSGSLAFGGVPAPLGCQFGTRLTDPGIRSVTLTF